MVSIRLINSMKNQYELILINMQLGNTVGCCRVADALTLLESHCLYILEESPECP